MRTVGIRELKSRLSEYLRWVRSGESVRVTDRGEVVAELTPPGRDTSDPAVPPALSALAARGLATLGVAAAPALYRRLPNQGPRKVTAAEILDEERGSR